MLLRSGYAEINNPVGIEANLAFLGFGFMLMGLFDLVFLPMHYKNGYDLGKPFVISSIVLFFAIVLLEALDHIVPYMKTGLQKATPPQTSSASCPFCSAAWPSTRWRSGSPTGNPPPGSKRSICKPRYCAHGAVSNILLRQPRFLRQQLPAFVSRRPHCADGRDFLISVADRLRKSCLFVKPAIFLHIVYKCFTNPAHKGAIISVIETKRK